MKKIATRQLVPLTALLFVLGAGLASAQDGPRHGHRKMGILRVLARLDLTEAQKADVKRILDSRRATFESLRERARTDREALNELAQATSPDTAAVGAAFLRVRSDREALRAERKATMEQIRSILTTEQKEELDRIMEERRERHGRRMGRPGP
jgi:Spy/CpxP family protein refolding chaperone